MPQGPRAVALATILSLVMPGLGHAYLGRLGRALIWFAGAFLLVAIANSDDAERWVLLAVLTPLGLASAFDAWWILREARSSRRS